MKDENVDPSRTLFSLRETVVTLKELCFECGARLLGRLELFGQALALGDERRVGAAAAGASECRHSRNVERLQIGARALQFFAQLVASCTQLIACRCALGERYN